MQILLLRGEYPRKPIKLPAFVGYPYDQRDVAICIDTKLAEEQGAIFWQNGSFAVLTQQVLNPNCFVHVENLSTGTIIRQKPKLPSTVQQAQHSIDKLFLSGSIEEVTERILSTSLNAGGDLSAEINDFNNSGAASSSEQAESGGLWDLLTAPKPPPGGPQVKEEEFQPEWGEEELPDFGSDEEDALGETIEQKEKQETQITTI